MKEESEKVGLKLNFQKTRIMVSSPITSCQIDGETMETVTDLILGGSKITADDDCSHEIKRPVPWKTSYDKSRQQSKRQGHCFTNNRPSSQSYGFSSSNMWMWELDHRVTWVLKNSCFWTVVLERTLESPFPIGNQSWIFEGLMLKLKLKKADIGLILNMNMSKNGKIIKIFFFCPIF